MSSLLPIGVFARKVGLPPSALRHYDGVGLLTPAQIDPVSGYRFYDSEQNGRARLIVGLRAVGLSIAEMAEILSSPGDEAAELLIRIGADRLERATRDRERLLGIAAQFRNTVVPSTAAVGASNLAFALARIACQMGTPPFDVVQWVVHPEGVALFASDRFSLARWRVGTVGGRPCPSGPPRKLSVRGDAVELAVAWLRSQRKVTCTIDQGLTLVGESSSHLVASELRGHPDLSEFFDELEPEADHCELMEVAGLLGAGETSDLNVGGIAVSFTTELLSRALSTIVGDCVEICMTDPTSPVLLRSPAQPLHEFLLMPRRS
jgi:DNA-binding transcriptional MerR regulator